MAILRLLKLLVFFQLAGCVSLHPANTSRDNNVLSKQLTYNYDTSYILGGTYDTSSNAGTKVKTCIANSYNLDSWLINNPKSRLSFEENQTLQQTLDSLGVDINTKIKLPEHELNIPLAYAITNEFTGYILNLYYVYNYSSNISFKDGALSSGEKILTPEALVALHHSAQDFRNMCGDKFVSQIQGGVNVIIKISLSFTSIVEKNYYSENLDRITGLQNILNIIKTNPKNITFNIQSSGIQVGGNPEQLGQIFLKNGGKVSKDGYPELSCNSNVSEDTKCANLINDVMAYVNTIPQQIHSSKDLHLFSPVLSTWENVGVIPGTTNVNKDAIHAMNSLNKLYDDDFKILDFLNHFTLLLKVASSDSQNPFSVKVNELKNLYDLIAKLYSNPNYHLNDCFQGFINDTCIKTYNDFLTVRQHYTSNADLNNLLSYIVQNYYFTSLFTSIDPINYAPCEVFPVSDPLESLFAINCAGQVTFDKNNPVKIVQKATEISVNHLLYQYKTDSLHNGIFEYQFSDALRQDPFYPSSYYGNSMVLFNKDSAAKEGVFLVKYF